MACQMGGFLKIFSYKMYYSIYEIFVRNLVRCFVCLVSALLAACAPAEIQGYADPRPPERPVVSLAALVIADEALQSGSERELQRAATARHLAFVDARALAPPTRAYSDDEIRKELTAHGVDSLLEVTIGYTSARQTVEGGGLGRGFNLGVASGEAMKVQFGDRSTGLATGRRTEKPVKFMARLFDLSSGRVVWVGSGQTAAAPEHLSQMIAVRTSVEAIFRDLATKHLLDAPGG